MTKDFYFSNNNFLKADKHKKYFFVELIKKSVVLFATLTLFACMILTFAGCENKTDEPEIQDSPYVNADPEDPSPVVPDEPIQPETPKIESVSATEFVDKYKDIALQLALDLFEFHPAENNDRLCYSFEIDKEGMMLAVRSKSINYSGELRNIVIERIVFPAPISLVDVVNGDYEISYLNGTYTPESYFEFSPRLNHNEPEIIKALMEVCNITSGLNFYNVTDYPASMGEQDYYLANYNPETNTTYIYRVVVPNQYNLDAAESIKHCSDIRVDSIAASSKYQIKIKEYEVETDFQPITYEELVKYHSKKFNDGLDKHFIPAIGKKCYINFDTNKILSKDWTVKIENEQITDFQLTMNYDNGNNEILHKIIDVNLDTPLNYSDFTVENCDSILAESASNAYIMSNIHYTYLEEEQGKHDTLMSTLFEQCGSSYRKLSGATRYFWQADTVFDYIWGKTTRIFIYEKYWDTVTTYMLRVKYAETDEEIIKYIQQGYFELAQTREMKILTGESFSYTEETDSTSTAQALKVYATTELLNRKRKLMR